MHNGATAMASPAVKKSSAVEGESPCGGSPAVVSAKPTGRPPKYSSPEQLQKVIEEYFQDCEDRERPYTMAGLALQLGMTTQGLREYQAKDNFSCIIKNAKQKIEQSVEEHLFNGKPVGAIFWLKNHAGYTDKTDHNVNVAMTLEQLVAGARE